MMFQRSTSALALAVEPDGLVLCRMRMRAGSAEPAGIWRLPVPGDRLRTDPDGAAEDLRRLLAEAGIRREACAVCLPLNWSFTYAFEYGDELTSSELRDFLVEQVDERCPAGLTDLSYAALPPDPLKDGLPLFFAAVPLDHVNAVESALRSAGLRPTSMTLQTESFIQASSMLDGIVLTFGRSSVDLGMVLDGQILTLRNLFWAGTHCGAETPGYVREIVRQVRMSLGQLPADQQERLTTVTLSGLAHLPAADRVVLSEALAKLGLTVESDPAGPQETPDEVPADLAARARLQLKGIRPRIELLPKRVSRLQQTALRFSERRTRLLVGGAAAVVFLAATLLIVQHRRLASLEAEWAAIEPQVASVRELEEQVRQYRAWYDDSAPSLTLARNIATAFPDEGTVWVKVLQIKDRSTATCTGSARSRADWMAVLEKLRTGEGIRDVQVSDEKGPAPLKFTLTLRWGGGDDGGR